MTSPDHVVRGEIKHFGEVPHLRLGVCVEPARLSSQLGYLTGHVTEEVLGYDVIGEEVEASHQTLPEQGAAHGPVHRPFHYLYRTGRRNVKKSERASEASISLRGKFNPITISFYANSYSSLHDKSFTVYKFVFEGEGNCKQKKLTESRAATAPVTPHVPTMCTYRTGEMIMIRL